MAHDSQPREPSPTGREIPRQLLLLAIRWNAMCARREQLRDCEQQERRGFDTGTCCREHRAHFQNVDDIMRECAFFTPDSFHGALCNPSWWLSVGFETDLVTSTIKVANASSDGK